MNFVADDMNGDGVLDLVFPPTRKGGGMPAILLGTGGGAFSYWKGVSWADKVPYDYGGVDTGDFDGDGHRDIVLAIHFKGQYDLLFGDGEGGSRSRCCSEPRSARYIKSRGGGRLQRRRPG